MAGGTSVVVDGSNLAGLPNGGGFDGARLRLAVEQLVADFANRSDIVVFVDASLRHQVNEETRVWLDAQTKQDRVRPAPAGINADPFLLDWANQHDAIVISNDMFREFEDRYPWIKAQGSGRCVSAMFDLTSKRWTFLEKRPGQRAARLLDELLPKAKSSRPLPPPSGAPSPTSAVGVPTSPAPPPKASAGRPMYRRQITRNDPHSIVFLLDQSGSMAAPWSDVLSKADRLTAILNDTIRELVITSSRTEGVRPYFHLAVLGYGGGGVVSHLKGTTVDEPFRSITAIHDESEMVEEVINGRRRTRPVYLRMRADGATPMCAAFGVAEKVLKTQIARYRTSFPPIVINITDGVPTDGDPSPVAQRVASLSTDDGNVLIMNAHISSDATEKLRFPSTLPPGSSTHAALLFRMSSTLPESFRLKGKDLGITIPPGGRGVLVNASPDEVVALLNIGTQTTLMKGFGDGPL